MSNICKICTYNVNGMSDIVKRRKIFGILKQFDVDIAMLQETHSTQDSVKMWQSEWRGKIYATSSNSASKGVMILLAERLHYKIHNVETDEEGRIIIIEIEIEKVVYLLVNVYAPNNDDVSFFTKVYDMINAFENCNIVWGGDFNLVLDVQIDRNSSSYNNVKALQVLKTAIEELELCDVWRVRHPDIKRYTWSRGNLKSRLDFFLINQGISSKVHSAKIISVPVSDHDHSTIGFLYNTPSTRSWVVEAQHVPST